MHNKCMGLYGNLAAIFAFVTFNYRSKFIQDLSVVNLFPENIFDFGCMQHMQILILGPKTCPVGIQ